MKKIMIAVIFLLIAFWTVQYYWTIKLFETGEFVPLISLILSVLFVIGLISAFFFAPKPLQKKIGVASGVFFILASLNAAIICLMIKAQEMTVASHFLDNSNVLYGLKLFFLIPLVGFCDSGFFSVNGKGLLLFGGLSFVIACVFFILRLFWSSEKRIRARA